MAINVTKTFLPPFEEYTALIKRAWDKSWITNNGELVQELEYKLKEYLDVKHLWFCNNGTVVLQMALKALNITGEVITTPFSYVATTNSILWENAVPIYVDINKFNYCIDADKIEHHISENTQAILATHVYGFPCDVEKIEKVAQKFNLKVIYDGAHAFGSKFKGRSLLDYGDISTCSFHATKLFHTVEGGCIICKDDEIANKVMLYRQFGHVYDDYYSIGINAKNSEFHAAMGLAVLPKVPEIISQRKHIFYTYCSKLSNSPLDFLNIGYSELEWNFSYCPVLFQNEESLLYIRSKLQESGYNTRRYFYPALNTLSFVKKQECAVAEDISKRILCLPIYADLSIDDVLNICNIINDSL